MRNPILTFAALAAIVGGAIAGSNQKQQPDETPTVAEVVQQFEPITENDSFRGAIPAPEIRTQTPPLVVPVAAPVVDGAVQPQKAGATCCNGDCCKCDPSRTPYYYSGADRKWYPTRSFTTAEAAAENSRLERRTPVNAAATPASQLRAPIILPQFGGDCVNGQCANGVCFGGNCATGGCASGNCGTGYARRGLFRRGR